MKEGNRNPEPQIHAQAARLAARMQKELTQLHRDPPHGVCAWPRHDNLLTDLEAQIEGPEETVYEKGIFKLQIKVPERYPFEPPIVRFETAIYHPNIDSGGRTCLDILNLPPKGAWRPSLNIATVLASVRCLLAEPNPDDGLMGDISAEYKHNRSTFDKKARSCTQKYAVQKECQINTSPVNISTSDWSLQTEQISNERIDDLEKLKKAALESLCGSQSQTNNKVEPKGDNVPIRSTKSLSKRLSLAKEPSSEERVIDNSTEVYNHNVNLQPAKCADMDVQQKLPTPFVETNESGKKLPHGVGIGNSFGLLENVSKKQGRSVQNAAVIGKENLNPTTWSVEKHPSKLSLLNMKTVPLQNSMSGNSNQRISIPQHGVLHEQEPTRSRKHRLSISGSVQSEDAYKENTDKRVEVETIIVSDSESDEEPIQVNRSKLSLSQRTLTGKRKFSSKS